MPEDEKPVIQTEEPTEEGSLTVDVNPPPATAPPIQKPGESDAAYDRRISALENRTAGAQRILQKMSQQVEELSRRGAPQAQPAAPQALPQNLTDDVSKMLFSGDPEKVKQGITLLASQQAEEIVRRKDQERQVQDYNRQLEQSFEYSKQWVETRYPMLDRKKGDPDHPFSQVYNEAIETHPEWLRDPNGPRLALQEAEELARQRGIKATPTQPAIAPNQEVIRRSRASVSSIPPSRQGIETPSKVTLTKEELEICSRNNISPESYAKSKLSLEQGAY